MKFNRLIYQKKILLLIKIIYKIIDKINKTKHQL